MRPGSQTANGRTVIGTMDALKEELASTLTAVMGPESEAMRTRIGSLRDSMERGLQPGGETYEALMRFGAL